METLRKTSIFFLCGMLLSLLGEVVVKLLIEQNPPDFFSFSLFLNNALLFFILVSFYYFSLRLAIKLEFYYLLGFMLGIMIEWYGLGNTPLLNTMLNTIAMFFYWSAIVLFPAAAVEKEFSRGRRNILALFMGMILLDAVLIYLVKLSPAAPFFWVLLIASYVFVAICAWSQLVKAQLLKWWFVSLMAFLFLLGNLLYRVMVLI